MNVQNITGYRSHKGHPDKTTPLLDLLKRREEAGDVRPEIVDPSGRGIANRAVAADLHAQANKSDPFARARITLHLSRGYDHPATVAKEAIAEIGRRRAEIENKAARK